MLSTECVRRGCPRSLAENASRARQVAGYRYVRKRVAVAACVEPGPVDELDEGKEEGPPAPRPRAKPTLRPSVVQMERDVAEFFDDDDERARGAR